MSDPPFGDDPFDPFLSDDPAAREREARRREREARRNEREARDAEKLAREQEREAHRRELEAQRQSDRELETQRQRDRELEPPPPPALLDEPAPVLDPWKDDPWVDAAEVEDRSAAAPRPPRSRKRITALVIGGVVLGVIAWFAIALFQPFAGDPGADRQVRIQKGATLGEIADLLAEEGVISNATMFEIRATLAGRRSDLLAGNYTLQEGITYSAALDLLTTPAPQRSNTVTIPEGLTREQIAEVVSDSGVEGSYAQATRSSDVLDPADYGAKDAENLEGFLFPDTYELKPHATAEDLATIQLEAFERNFAEVDMSYAESKNLSEYDVLIIASMIEEEALVPEDRPLVARVIYNRLADGGPLGIDATIRYAQANYDEPLLESDLAIDSPYNTYTQAGLPPTPIANPGIASIEAAANPAEGDWYYFVVKPGTCGELEFSTTAAEHDAAVERYHAARDAAGGRSPVEC